MQRKGMAILFEKPSLRTRNAMEMAVVQLGGHPVTLKRDETREKRLAATVAWLTEGKARNWKYMNC